MASYDAVEESAVTFLPVLDEISPPTTWTSWSLLELSPPLTGDAEDVTTTTSGTSHPGVVALSPMDSWFERVVVVPKRIDAGNILQELIFELDFANMYRYTRRSLDSYVNNAGGGITVPDLPSLPVDVNVFETLTLHLHILLDGPAVIDGDVDFIFDDRAVVIPITGTRTILLTAEPVIPLVETLGFKTGILLKRDGTEQRSALRMHPRQTFDLMYLTESLERQLLEARVFAGQDRTFGIPLWAEASVLTATALTGAATVSVDDTRYRDYRVGETVILWTSATEYQSLTLLSKTNTTLTFTDVLTADFVAGDRAMPVRTAKMSQKISGERYHRNLQRTRLKMTVTNAGIDLADTSSFSTYAGKVLLDDPNAAQETATEDWDRAGTVIDGETGLFTLETVYPVARRGSTKTFVTRTQASKWAVRQLLHALRGRAVSFYLPTFFDDFAVTQNVTSGSSVLRFKNFGFKKFVDAQKPRGVVRLVTTAGTKVARAISSSTEIDDETEEITVSSSWGVDATVDEIDRVEYLELSRLDTDDVQITHEDGIGGATVTIPVRSVLE